MYHQKYYANWYIKGSTSYSCSKNWHNNLFNTERRFIEITVLAILNDLSDLNQEKK